MIRFCRPLRHGIVIWGSLFSIGAGVAAETHEGSETAPTVSIYDPDPQHLWNRVHAAIMVRTGPDGIAYGQDRLEPLLWAESTHLLQGDAADRVVQVLGEFVRNGGDLLIGDTTKRALLQRDLWLVANWLAQKPDNDRKELLQLLVKSIRLLALPPRQIELLPDNYSLAIASRRFGARIDPQDPMRPYLPPNLFDLDGPWVCVGREDGRTAPLHLQSNANNSFTNSAFLVLLKLPGGRKATLDFLQQLKTWNRPPFIAGLGDNAGQTRSHPNPNAPVLPAGTELALVRRALLIDTAGQIVASPLTESVQLRVILQSVTPRSIAELSPSMDERNRQMGAFEFQIRRKTLLAGDAGGLCEVTTTRDFKTGFASHSWDEFERDHSDVRPFLEGAQPFTTIRHSCLGCHATSSLHGTMSFQRYISPDDKLDDRSPPLYPVSAMSTRDVERAAIQWKQQQPDWLTIRRLLLE